MHWSRVCTVLCRVTCALESCVHCQTTVSSDLCTGVVCALSVSCAYYCGLSCILAPIDCTDVSCNLYTHPQLVMPLVLRSGGGGQYNTHHTLLNKAHKSRQQPAHTHTHTHTENSSCRVGFKSIDYCFFCILCLKIWESRKNEAC